MPLYDYECFKCGFHVEKLHKIAETPTFFCPDCLIELDKVIVPGHGGIRTSDPSWVQNINGIVNDLEFVQKGKQEKIETREQARRKIAEMYADPYKEPKTKSEEAANKRVGALRQRYTERY